MTRTATARYPRTFRAGDLKLTLRPLQKSDAGELLKFLKRLPVDERRMLKDDVTDRRVVAAWCAKIDLERVFPLVALDGKRIVADATLHRSRAGWSSHVAALRLTVDEDYRRCGLGREMVRDLLKIAEQAGVAIVDAEMLSAQRVAIRLFEELGFHCIATLPHHALDLTHQPHDLVVMSLTLTPVAELSPDARRNADEVDEGGAG